LSPFTNSAGSIFEERVVKLIISEKKILTFSNDSAMVCSPSINRSAIEIGKIL